MCIVNYLRITYKLGVNYTAQNPKTDKPNNLLKDSNKKLRKKKTHKKRKIKKQTSNMLKKTLNKQGKSSIFAVL